MFSFTWALLHHSPPTFWESGAFNTQRKARLTTQQKLPQKDPESSYVTKALPSSSMRGIRDFPFPIKGAGHLDLIFTREKLKHSFMIHIVYTIKFDYFWIQAQMSHSYHGMWMVCVVRRGGVAPRGSGDPTESETSELRYYLSTTQKKVSDLFSVKWNPWVISRVPFNSQFWGF